MVPGSCGDERLHSRLELEVQALRHEVLDQEGGLGNGGGLGVGVNLGAPGAGHGRAGERQRRRAPALALVSERHARVLDAVGAREDDGDGNARRLAGAVARQGGQVHLLAGAVDAAIGIGEGVDRAWRDAALDAAVGEVEGTGRQIEEGVIAIARLGDQHGWRQPALAALEPGIEAGVAAAVGLDGAQHLVVAGDQAHIGVDHRRGGRERAHEGVHAVVAVDGGEAEIGDDEPLRGGIAIAIVLLLGRGVGRQHVDAGLQLGDGLGDGEGASSHPR